MKTTIRTKGEMYTTRRSLFSMVFIAGICMFTSCSDNELDGHVTESAKIDAGNVIINNDVAELAKQVQLYKGKKDAADARAAIKSFTHSFTMPEQPVIPAEAVDVTSEEFQDWKPKGNAFVLKAGKQKSLDVNLNNAEWFVEGEMTLRSHWGKGKIYILPGGKLIFQPQTLSDVEIYNYRGTFEPVGNTKLTVNGNAAYMTVGDFVTDKELSIGGKLYAGGDFSALSLTANNESKIYVGGDAMLDSHSEVTNNTSMYVNGKLTAPSFELNSSAAVTVDCKAVFSEKLYVTNNATFEVLDGGYAESPNTELTSQGHLLVGSKGCLDLGNLKLTNTNDGSTIEATGEEYAVVKAAVISVNNNDLRKMFTGYMGLHFDTMNADGTLNDIEFQANVKINEADDTYIPATGCSPGFGTAPSEPGQKDIIIDHIANVENPDPDHTHDISATCVQMVDNKAYVSFHRQGAGYSGCAEVISFDTPETLSLVSYMRSVEKRDFNHLIVDDGKLYLTGGENKGAFLACIPLTEGVFQSGDADRLNIVRLPGSDANCVVRNGNYYQVATTTGFHTLNISDYSTLVSKTTPGSAKFIHLNGDKLLTLNLADRNSGQSAAVVNIYNPSDYSFTTPLSTISEGIISPVDGKNVSHADGNHVYACLGENGFVRYTNGAANGTFKIDGSKSAVNGMDFDDRFIYIAYGSEGLYVLDKETLEVVASYTYSGGKSANYVKVVNGYIYVAYGRNGLQVFKLTEK